MAVRVENNLLADAFSNRIHFWSCSSGSRMVFASKDAGIGLLETEKENSNLAT